MLNLPQVTLVIHEGVDARKAVAPTLNTLRHVNFRKVILFAPRIPEELEMHLDEFHPVQWTYEDWNRHVILELKDHIHDGWCLHIHHDAFVLNPNAWTNEFLNYDYVGAPWPWEHGYLVGNGGFTLRSKRYVESTAAIATDHKIERFAPEDHEFIRRRGQWLEDRGVQFAPVELAKQFSLEGNAKFGKKWDGQFGFHDFSMTDLSLYWERNPDAIRPHV